MVQHSHADTHDSATQSKFYLPAGDTRSSNATWMDRLWARLFNHRV